MLKEQYLHGYALAFYFLLKGVLKIRNCLSAGNFYTVVFCMSHY